VCVCVCMCVQEYTCMHVWKCVFTGWVSACSCRYAWEFPIWCMHVCASYYKENRMVISIYILTNSMWWHCLCTCKPDNVCGLFSPHTQTFDPHCLLIYAMYTGCGGLAGGVASWFSLWTSRQLVCYLHQPGSCWGKHLCQHEMFAFFILSQLYN
jgi:hypothetical protein